MRATLPGGRVVDGVGQGIDVDGRLMLGLPDGTTVPVSAGDVTVLR